ncbi:MAG: aspartate/glutamate racemase family protein [Betaproteobacteria bacterium]
MSNDAPPLGIVMLDTAFPRPPGDIGNPASFPFPVFYDTVPSATVRRIVGSQPDPALLAPFVAAGHRLIGRGCARITTSCGFLVLWQAPLAQALAVPVLASSLLILPRLPDAGVLTFDPALLGAAHLAAAGANVATPVEGLQREDSLYRTIAEDRAELDQAVAQGEVIAAGRRLLRRAPRISSIVLECTNFGPYRAALAMALGLPVHGIVEALIDPAFQ